MIENVLSVMNNRIPVDGKLSKSREKSINQIVGKISQFLTILPLCPVQCKIDILEEYEGFILRTFTRTIISIF